MTFAQPFTDYEILDRVGAGAMGTVFKARHKKLNRIVALKVLKPSLARDSRYVDRLRREARIVASLSDPHIVTGYDLGDEGGYHFFVMEFIEGKSLRALLVEWGVFAEQYVLKVGKQVAQALDHAYQRGVIHRDIKPGNILIDEHGNVKLTDMGLAKGPADLTLTRDGATVGTPQYISPEQARNPQDVDVRSDLYSLGATLYHMATGVPPFRGDTMAELITKVLHDTPVPPNEQNPAVSEGMSLVLRKLLAKDLRVRYQTPRELLDDLARIEQELPPEVDEQRLSIGEGQRRANLWLRSAAVLGITAVLGAAVWLGMQFGGDGAVVPPADPFFARLDATLRDLPTPGERLSHLRTLAAGALPGTESGLSQRERTAFAELQACVDATAVGLLDTGWAELVTWLRDPAVWPDRRRCDERILRAMRERCGVVPRQLPPTLSTARLEDLNAAIDRELAARDAELLRRFDLFLAKSLTGRVEELLRRFDYAGAQALWQNAIPEFFTGFGVPLAALVADPTLAKAAEYRDRHLLLHRPAIALAESKTIDAMRELVGTVVRDLGERLANGADAELVGDALARLSQELLTVWPASAKFRPPGNPWPEIERQIGELRQRVLAAAAATEVRRFERRIDLAWRVLCNGSAADAVAVLADLVPPTERHAVLLANHRRALQSAAAVSDALLAAMLAANVPIAAFPRTGSGFAVDLRVETESGRPALWSHAAGQGARRASVTEFRFGKLLEQVRKVAGDPFAALPREVSSLGTAVSMMVGDDLQGLESRVRDLDAFVLDHVWPRILRVRGELAETVLDRAATFARLAEAHENVLRSGNADQAGSVRLLHELERAILTCSGLVDDDDLTDKERHQLYKARTAFKLARRRGDVLADVTRDAPPGAAVEVAVTGDEITAEVTVPAALLLRGAAGGSWQMHNGDLEFAGGERPWHELAQQELKCNTGLDEATGSTLQLDLILPPASVGPRLYFVEFRGITVVVAISATDAVYAALLDGDVRREEHAQRAFQRAMQGALDKPKAVIVPGGVHRLTLEILGRRRAAVRLMLEGTTLLEEQRDLDPQKPATFYLHPRQELAVQKVVVRGAGL